MRSGKLGMWVVFACAAMLGVALPAHADTAEAVRTLLKSMTGPNMTTGPRVTNTSEGYLEFVAASSGNSFRPSPTAKAAGGPDAIAKAFLLENAEAFGIHIDGTTFSTNRVKSVNARTYVRLDQMYKGVPVFGAQVVVQMKPGGAVVSVLSDIMRDAPKVYSGAVSLKPGLSVSQAKTVAKAVLKAEHPADNFVAGEPIVNIYMPSVVGATGTARLVYVVEVITVRPGLPSDERILIDAQTGATVLRIPMVKEAKNRTIFDAENVPGVAPGTLKRSEGQPPANITDVDQAYDYYGDTYDFYFNEHGRDSIDNAGLTMDATVRYCPNSSSCPFQNAFWTDFEKRMYFGDGFTADDVVGHELTHGVTSSESDLIYFGESGALNESFSDVWGEFIDLTNGKGTDAPDVRWLLGEDIPGIGAIRDMQDPHTFFNPDTYLGQYWVYDPNFDNGGVHINSGVSNKLCYLLTDGDTFNGFVITGMGIPLVADLYYECQTNLLVPSSSYPNFGDQLLTAAQNLGLSNFEIANIESALAATEIKKFAFLFLRHFRASGKSGDNRVALAWRNPSGGAFTGVDIVRNTSRFPNDNTDGTVIASVTNGAERWIDTPGGSDGTDVYYGLFPKAGSLSGNRPLFARATIGVDVDYLSEAFTNGTDMANSQITFVPAGAVPVTGPATQRPDVYFNYTTYAAHRAADSKIAPTFDGTLPVQKVDYVLLPMGDDGTVSISSPLPVPFFGNFIRNFVLSANGFIADAAKFASAQSQYSGDDPNATFTLDNHFRVPRISFLYGDLNPRSGGVVWARFLDDRMAVTFENVPAYEDSTQPGLSYTNTVQCELFYGGQIRFTYLDLSIKRAVVGISDGNGLPLNVDDLFAGSNSPAAAQSNLSSLPGTTELELQPVPIMYITPGQIVNFTLTAESTVGTPVFSMIPIDLGGLPLTGATLDPQTGEFIWNSAGAQDGVYAAILCATAGEFSSCQTFAIVVTTATTVPAAVNVELAPTSPRDSDNLVANYTYVHPSVPEGPTVIYWFNQNAIIPAYTNQKVLPASVTKAGETWYFQVVPSTIQVGSLGSENVYLIGSPVLSNAVTIQPDNKVDANGDGKVNAVDLQLVVRGLLGTADAGIDPDVNGDGRQDASDVQTTINYILEKR